MFKFIKIILAKYRGYLRWKKADNLGWKLLGLYLREKNDTFRRRWIERNMMRIYRITRGSGNPWKEAEN